VEFVGLGLVLVEVDSFVLSWLLRDDIWSKNGNYNSMKGVINDVRVIGEGSENFKKCNCLGFTVLMWSNTLPDFQKGQNTQCKSSRIDMSSDVSTLRGKKQNSIFKKIYHLAELANIILIVFYYYKLMCGFEYHVWT